jgi:Spy/CpxP family protein refolding chaperone
MVRLLKLTPDQQRKMDDIFQRHRLRLIDLSANLQKEEATLEPLMNAAQPDDSKILPQIDRIAQARAELEKADARLQLALRHVLTQEQWEVLRSEDRRPRPPGPGRRDD